jgi:hypothetical protein
LRRVGQADEQIDFRNLGAQLRAITLHQAAHGDDRAHRTLLLQADRAENRSNGFLLGEIDEAAGVDDDYVGILRTGPHGGTGADEPCQNMLAVDRVLVAAERDDAYAHGVRIGRRPVGRHRGSLRRAEHR